MATFKLFLNDLHAVVYINIFITTSITTIFIILPEINRNNNSIKLIN